MPPMELIGMVSMKCVIKNGKWGQRLKGFNLLAQQISCTTWDNLSPQASLMDVHNLHEACGYTYYG